MPIRGDLAHQYLSKFQEALLLLLGLRNPMQTDVFFANAIGKHYQQRPARGVQAAKRFCMNFYARDGFEWMESQATRIIFVVSFDVYYQTITYYYDVAISPSSMANSITLYLGSNKEAFDALYISCI